MRNPAIFMFLGAVLLLAGIANGGPSQRPAVNYPLETEIHDLPSAAAIPPYPIPLQSDNLDIVGDTVVMGTTWYENQSLGAAGRRIMRTEDGYTHFVWLNGLDYGSVTRPIYYNYIDPNEVQGWPGVGYFVEASSRCGYPTLDVDSTGRAYIGFHSTNYPGGVYNTGVFVDFYPHSGTFIGYQTPYAPGGLEVLWPKIQLDRDGTIHMIATTLPTLPGDPQRDHCISGTFDLVTFMLTWDPSWTPLDWTMTCVSDIATSPVSDRLAIAWTHPMEVGFPYYGNPSQWSNDIYVLIDEDGINPNFEEAFNLTNFLYPFYNLLPDTLYANTDTLRAYTDISLFFDRDDFLHAVFTTPSYFAIQSTRYWHASIVWHWSEQTGEFSMVHNAFDDWWWNYVDCGAWNVKAQRAQMGQDPSTGYLYCTYQVYDCDTMAISAGGWPSGEVYVSVSTDGGANWAVGTNVTETVTPNSADPGQCLSEISPAMADLVDGDIHILYCLDKDAGFVVQTEGTWTLNDMIYHRVPVDLIPTTPLVEQNVPFHVELAAIYDFYVELTPFSPTSFPAAGGVLDYNLEGGNSGFLFTPVDIWAEVMIPPSGEAITVMGPIEDFPMNPGWSANRDRQLTVPGNAPEGNYILYAYIGDYDPGLPTIYVVDRIFFDKSGTLDAAGGSTFEDVGESFIDLLSMDVQDVRVSPKLYQNTPNPFNPTTTLSFSLSIESNVNLSIYDISGRLVKTLIDKRLTAGDYDFSFDVTQGNSSLASGVYIYRLNAGEFGDCGKMVLLK